MSTCDNFVEQLWRKGKCANCFQSQERHQNGGENRDDTSSANRTANCTPKRVLIHPQSPSNRNVKAFNVEKTAKSFKDENGKEENNLEGANGVKTIAPSAHDNTASRGDRIASDTSKDEQHSKSFVVTKPKPVPRPKPRPPTRAIELEKSVESRDESPQESDDGVNDSSAALENSLGKSHIRPQCNANSMENSEVVLSIPDHNIKESEELYNESNIETVCETIVDEEAISLMNEEDSIDKDSADDDENEKIASKDAAVVDSSQNVIDLTDLKIEDDDDSDGDGYVPMKSNIVLFTSEPIQVHNIHKTDVMELNSEVNLDLHGKTTSDNGTMMAANTCDSEIDEGSETSSVVLEFRNPLCLITNEIAGSSDDSEIANGVCDRLNSNKISSKANSIEPFYVNRPCSTSSSDTTSSSHDSGYENTRKTTRSNSTNSASGNSSDVAANVNIEEGDSADAPVYVVCTETSDCCAAESSETSSSSWGSSTWDSCSTSDFQENSCEGLLGDRAFGKFDAKKKPNKHHPEASATQLKTGQAVVADKGSVDASHVYVNMALNKPFTKPYKVVDISTGVSCPTDESQNDVPPLPPKEKDLKKDKMEEFKHHVYLEPSDEAPSRSEHGPPDDKKEAVIDPMETAFSSPPPSPASNSTTDKSVTVRRAPAPRPRSRVPSQFGTLPKPAPRMSRILNDAPVENKEVKEQKVSTARPVGEWFVLS